MRVHPFLSLFEMFLVEIVSSSSNFVPMRTLCRKLGVDIQTDSSVKPHRWELFESSCLEWIPPPKLQLQLNVQMLLWSTAPTAPSTHSQ